MAKASQVVLLENEFYLIKAPNGKVLEIKNFNTENGAAIRLWDYAGHPWQQWQLVDAGEGRWRIRNRFTGKFIDLARKAVPDPQASLASVHELPLLPRMPGVVPQTDGSAVLRVEVLYFQHLSIGGLDEVKLIFR